LIGYDAILGDDEKAIEAPGKPPVVRDSDHGVLEPVEAVLEGLCRVHVQVIGRLVEEQQCSASDLEQQDKNRAC
jgi:hypothetical protein